MSKEHEHSLLLGWALTHLLCPGRDQTGSVTGEIYSRALAAPKVEGQTIR